MYNFVYHSRKYDFEQLITEWKSLLVMHFNSDVPEIPWLDVTELFWSIRAFHAVLKAFVLVKTRTLCNYNAHLGCASMIFFVCLHSSY